MFAECLKAYKAFSAASNLTSDFRILKTKFQIEETRFTQWGIHWGYGTQPSECILEETVEDAGQNVAATVKLTLLQISTLLKEYDVVSTRYDNQSRGAAYRGMVWAVKDKGAEATIGRKRQNRRRNSL